MKSPIRVLMLTSEWPSPELPHHVPFLLQQIEFLRRAGVEIDVFSFRGARNPINYLRAWRRLRKHLDSKSYDVVHAQFGQSGLLPWPKKLPLVVTFHGCEILGVKDAQGRTTLPGRMMRALCKPVAWGADAVVVVSKQMKKYLPSSVSPHVLPTGVDLDSMPSMPSIQEARRLFDLPQDEKLALFVGNPDMTHPEGQRKRYSLAQQAVDLLNQRYPVKLVIGWGYPHNDIIKLMHACDVLVVVSRQEGSPTIVKEALACNLPVVSVIVGDVPERLEGVEGCEICPDDRPETIADALERVLRRGKRIDGQKVMKNLDEQVLAQKMIDIYRSVMNGKYSD
jgi:glycosyltransferase involved in cell wall biosynthesis